MSWQILAISSSGIWLSADVVLAHAISAARSSSVRAPRLQQRSTRRALAVSSTKRPCSSSSEPAAGRDLCPLSKSSNSHVSIFRTIARAGELDAKAEPQN